MTPLEISSLSIIVFAALIHASFQLSFSVLTLLSGHSLGKKTARKKLSRLIKSFIGGVFLLSVFLTSVVVYYLLISIKQFESVEKLVAAITCGLMFGLAVATWAFYYRKNSGTGLWLPRGAADYLNKRSKSTKNSFEAFSLGMASVVGELVFIIGPVLAASLAIITLPDPSLQIVSIFGYVFISLLPLLILAILVENGHSIASLQRWRERNKRFLQFVAGGSLLILAMFIFVDRIIGISSYGGLW